MRTEPCSSLKQYNSTFICASLRRIVLTLTCCSLIGCSQGTGSRIAHYRGGGSYSGSGPSVSPDGMYVLFSSPRTGNGDIYRVNIDGLNVTQLTSNVAFECDAECSPDGKSIAYIREGNRQGDIWIMNADGTGQRQLTNSHGDKGGPRFSPDGLQIVFYRSVPALETRVGIFGSWELYSVDVKTGLETRLTDNRVKDLCPTVSPDGKSIAFTRDDQISIMSRDGTNPKRLGSGWQPAFSPDSKLIVASAGAFSRQIDVMNVDGSERRTIYSKNTRVSHPVFSSDGLAILFLEEPKATGVGNIIIIRLDGTDTKMISHTF